MMQWQSGTSIHIFVSKQEEACVYGAVQDLIVDIQRVLQAEVHLEAWERQDQAGIYVMTQPDESWESYRTEVSEEGSVTIIGSDSRGTMWGIYDFCERVLGVDPLYLWTDHKPVPMTGLQLAAGISTGAPEFRYRAWFINDEDFLTEWRTGGGSRTIDYPFYHQVIAPSVQNMIVETALRLKLNLLIPASFLDIDNPAEEQLVKLVTQRGLFISQHHVEPLGVSHFAWERYWKQRGVEVDPSFVRNPVHYEEIWTHYVRKWAGYKQVLWQLGLRGRADEPVWERDPSVRAEMSERGALISSAIRMQYDIVLRETGEREAPCTITLWQEGAELYRQGYLQLPDEAMVIFSDFGPTQLWDRDFYETARAPHRSYGVYYHAAYWSRGPHLAEGNTLRKISDSYREAVHMGDTAYSICNTANIREFLFSLEAIARMTWSMEHWDDHSFRLAWMKRQFGEASAYVSSELRRSYDDALVRVKQEQHPDELLLSDGALRTVGLRLLRWINNPETPDPRLHTPNPLFDFADKESFILYYKAATKQSVEAWQQYVRSCMEVSIMVEEDRKPFFHALFEVQGVIMGALHTWVYHLCCAAELKLNGQKSDEQQILRAADALERLLRARAVAEHGLWVG